MKVVSLIVLVFLGPLFKSPNTDFMSEQKKYDHVRVAVKEKSDVILSKLESENIKLEELRILIVAYKEEQQFDLYAKNKNDASYKKLISYPICALSGQLGPKRQQGDGQVPEGFYNINVFNPTSGYYLSLGINYPNAADRKKSQAKDLGGSIFIHGECVTIGCMPMTNDKIKEIYLYAIHARQNGEMSIPVYVFPFKMGKENMEKHKNLYKNTELIAFWENIKIGHDKFTLEQKELKWTVDKEGNYMF